MATDQRNVLAYFATDADFRAWATAIHNQLIAVGLVQTPDTGQINLTTVTMPSSTGVFQGYEVFRFNDTLQATLPIFVKIEYGSSNVVGGSTNPALAMTVGTSTNGAGTITGQASARRIAQTQAAKSAGVVLPSYACGDGSGFALFTNFDIATTSFCYDLVVERSRDGSGNATADAIYVHWGSGTTNGASIQTLPPSGPVSPAGATYGNQTGMAMSPTLWAISFGPGTVGANVPVVPLMFVCGKCLFLRLLHLVQGSQVSAGVPFTATVFGGTHTLLPLVLNGYQSPSGYTGADDLCLLWE